MANVRMRPQKRRPCRHLGVRELFEAPTSIGVRCLGCGAEHVPSNEKPTPQWARQLYMTVLGGLP